MADQRDGGIAWTDQSWNPVRGCSRVSEGCRHCYAEGVAARFSGPGQPYEGLALRKLKVISDDEQRTEAKWTGEVRFVPEHLADPLRWQRPRRIFVNSMSDLFHEKVSNEQIAAVFGVMAAAPQHTYQVLTKRPKRMLEWFKWVSTRAERVSDLEIRTCIAYADLYEVKRQHVEYTSWPLPNVWIGVSAENQATADERIPLLLQTPAAVRFVSAEPLLGPIEFDCISWPDGWRDPDDIVSDGVDPLRFDRAHLDWVIVGGESGVAARYCNLAWIRSIVAQCKAARVACFVKQLGRRPFADVGLPELPKDRKGADMIEWPEDLRVRLFPEASR